MRSSGVRNVLYVVRKASQYKTRSAGEKTHFISIKIIIYVNRHAFHHFHLAEQREIIASFSWNWKEEKILTIFLDVIF